MRERRKAETVLPPPMQLMLSDKEVAAMLGIGVSTVWKKQTIRQADFQSHSTSQIEPGAGESQTSSNGSRNSTTTRSYSRLRNRDPAEVAGS